MTLCIKKPSILVAVGNKVERGREGMRLLELSAKEEAWPWG